ncbi:hypothetical protein FKM82_021288 [Ascaphus truei]
MRSPQDSRSAKKGKCRAFIQLRGSWVKGHSAGGSRNNISFPSNPKFWLRVSEPSEAWLALMQRPRPGAGPSDRGRDGLWRAGTPQGPATCAVGLHVWKVEKRRFNLHKTLSCPPVVGTQTHSYDRQLHLRCDLSPGYYLLVPSTFLRDVEGDFLLRVLSTGRVSLRDITPPRAPVAVGDDVTRGAWETQELRGRWEKGHSAGGSRNFPSHHLNPSLPFSVPAGSPLVRVTLRQRCRGDQCHAIGFHVYSVPSSSSLSPHSQKPSASCVPHSHSQEVSQLFALSAGQYVLVPSTYLPDQESDFTVTIATKIERKPIQSRETLGRFVREVSVTTVMK